MLFASCSTRFRAVKLELLDMLRAPCSRYPAMVDGHVVHDVGTVLGREVLIADAAAVLIAAVSTVITRMSGGVVGGAGRGVGRGCKRRHTRRRHAFVTRMRHRAPHSAVVTIRAVACPVALADLVADAAAVLIAAVAAIVARMGSGIVGGAGRRICGRS